MQKKSAQNGWLELQSKSSQLALLYRRHSLLPRLQRVRRRMINHYCTHVQASAMKGAIIKTPRHQALFTDFYRAIASKPIALLSSNSSMITMWFGICSAAGKSDMLAIVSINLPSNYMLIDSKGQLKWLNKFRNRILCHLYQMLLKTTRHFMWEVITGLISW